MLTTGDILRSGMRVKKVKVPEWGRPGSNGDAYIYCRPCDALTYDRAKKMIAAGDEAEAVSYVTWRCACDKDGKRLFGKDDFEQFRDGTNVGASERVATLAMKLAGFTEPDRARKKK